MGQEYTVENGHCSTDLQDIQQTVKCMREYGGLATVFVITIEEVLCNVLAGEDPNCYTEVCTV